MSPVVEVTKIAPLVVTDLKYASSDNVLGRPLYDSSVALAHPDMAQALAEVSNELAPKGMRLVLWDAFRTADAHRQLRQYMSDERYVVEDSNHCRGLAADVTIMGLDGTLLDMATGHDDFSEAAHIDAAVTEPQGQNRQLLREVMEHHGFRQLPYEWWHYDFVGIMH